MSRIRTIKPGHWSDRELANISLPAHLLWIATWNFSDDDGVFEADPLLIKSQVFPRRTDIRVEQISQWLDQLVKARYIVPFEYKNEGYYITRTFKIHQRIDKPQPGIIPADDLMAIFKERSENVPGIFLPVKEGSSKGEGEDNTPNIAFSVFWDLYEKKVGEKDKLTKKWNSLTDQERQQAIEYIPKYKECQPDKLYRKDPQTFINNKSWNDELIKKNCQQNGNAIKFTNGKSRNPGLDEIAAGLKNDFSELNK
jgi:hypothetical protein